MRVLGSGNQQTGSISLPFTRSSRSRMCPPHVAIIDPIVAKEVHTRFWPVDISERSPCNFSERTLSVPRYATKFVLIEIRAKLVRSPSGSGQNWVEYGHLRTQARLEPSRAPPRDDSDRYRLNN